MVATGALETKDVDSHIKNTLNKQGYIQPKHLTE